MRRLTISLAALSALLIATVIGYMIFIAVDAEGPLRFKNVSGAMDSTLLSGDVITVRGIDAQARRQLERGVIVAHRWPEDRSKQFVKRIVGLPGDTLSMVGGVVHVNRRALPESYAWHEDSEQLDPAPQDFQWQRRYLANKSDSAKYHPSRDNWGPLVVPTDNYFVLGDNRDNSLDSRYWGFVPSEDVTGIVRRVYTSSDSLGRMRWRRFGHLVR